MQVTNSFRNLTDNQVRMIKFLASIGIEDTDLVKMFGCSKSNISEILVGTLYPNAEQID